jgi:hypothetical protein
VVAVVPGVGRFVGLAAQPVLELVDDLPAGGLLGEHDDLTPSDVQGGPRHQGRPAWWADARMMCTSPVTGGSPGLPRTASIFARAYASVSSSTSPSERSRTVGSVAWVSLPVMSVSFVEVR